MIDLDDIFCPVIWIDRKTAEALYPPYKEEVPLEEDQFQVDEENIDGLTSPTN